MDPGRDINIHNISNNIVQWRQLARVGSSSGSTHSELEVFGVVISGTNLLTLSKEMMNHQILVNRQGFMIMYFNVGAPHMYLFRDFRKPSVSLIRRLNDLFDWSKYGVQVHTPVDMAWDRFQLNTGRLMVGSKESEKQSMLEEKDGENKRLKEQLKEKDDQLLKHANELVEAKKKWEEEKRMEIEKLKEQLKEKDDQIHDQKLELVEAKKQDREEELKEQLKEKDNQIQEQKMELAEVKKQCEETHKENEKLEERSKENDKRMTKRLKEKDDQIQNLNETIEEMQTELDKLKKQLEENEKLKENEKGNIDVSSFNIAIRIIV
ncbi:Cortactin-binding protein 2 [Linum perenne]